MSLLNLQPQPLWQEFFNICNIPRGSGNTSAIRTYLKARASQFGYRCSVVSGQNLLITRPSDTGFEFAKRFCLQAHMDMVCSRRADSNHNFLTDPIKPRLIDIDGKQFITATGTTLGADNGIGVAAALTLISDPNLKCGEIEVLLTDDEETTMSGVHGVPCGLLGAKYLVNLDGFDFGKVVIGSAGAFTGFMKIPASYSSNLDEQQFFYIKAVSFTGGHSGMDIHKYRGNAIKILGRVLQSASELFQIRLCAINGGTASNAIPMDATAVIAVDQIKSDLIQHFISEMSQIIRSEYKATDPKCSVSISKCEPQPCSSPPDSQILIDFITQAPTGVARMSQLISGLTETSSSIGQISYRSDTGGQAVFLVRSSAESQLQAMFCQLQSLARLCGYDFSRDEACACWAPQLEGRLAGAFVKEYSRVLEIQQNQVVVAACHVGLEAGEIVAKHPGMEAVCTGPDIIGAHSDSERLGVESVGQWYECLKGVLQGIDQ